MKRPYVLVPPPDTRITLLPLSPRLSPLPLPWPLPSLAFGGVRESPPAAERLAARRSPAFDAAAAAAAAASGVVSSSANSTNFSRISASFPFRLSLKWPSHQPCHAGVLSVRGGIRPYLASSSAVRSMIGGGGGRGADAVAAAPSVAAAA
eukprot:CAMPEP_0119521162 /NCGR_PEP_ID=MMETSP1344-20130328/36956_1 /TAXON_ID=236787 /ORGANISM="Florenciella parvula, Strain CCMP2471" /LENGTH=149 /DNA_ID=CAMNT_0007559115 /DNA_START=96 /DNA_END=542 /DNA_ORIENTATION=-